MDVYARELGNALRQIGQNEVRVSDYRPHIPTWAQRVRSLPIVRGVARHITRYGVYQWDAWGRNADVNHIVDHGYGHLAFGLDPRRTVVTFHDAMLLKLQARELPTDHYPWITMLGHRMSLKAMANVAHIIVDSESSKSDLLQFTSYPSERVRVVPLGVSAAFRLGNRGVGQGREGQPPVIVHVGHCGAYKNIETILRAVPVVSRRIGRAVVFRKVGGAFSSRQCDLIRSLGIQQQVQHLGAISESALSEVYSQADVLLMPSLHEGFGLPVLEAMACGTPVVASNRGSLPEVVGDAGVLVEPTDHEVVGEAVSRVLTDPNLRAEITQRGLERVREFTWHRTAVETLKVYREVHSR
jgi:glycosyltransferase involved in cell wall biosynthesis